VAGELRLEELSRDRAGLRRFLRVPYRIYRGDPHWVAPLLSDRHLVLGRDNPFFDHAQGALWVAARDDRDIGSVAGIIDDHHNARYGERTAFFGFFESVDDVAVSRSLVDAVRGWARARGMTRLLGPMNPSINEECGLLVEGFHAPPVVMMTYNPPYYAALLAGAGFKRCKDLLAYDVPIDETQQARLDRLAARVLDRAGGITVRPVDKRAMARDVARIQEVYNAAWEDNWGHVPMTGAEIEFMAKRLTPLVEEQFVRLAETPEGTPVAFILGVPDVNEALGRLRGRLLSPRFALVLPYLARLKRPRFTRVIALGVKREYRQRGIEAALIAPCLRAMRRAGYQRCELSWILDDNTRIRGVTDIFRGTIYKRYALYEGCV
jgi:hypothetical protein